MSKTLTTVVAFECDICEICTPEDSVEAKDWAKGIVIGKETMDLCRECYETIQQYPDQKEYYKS